MSDQRFTETTAVVTGAGSGIGKATAVRLAEEGARVISADVSKERLDELSAEHPDLPLVTVTGDLTADATIEEIKAACEGTVDVLCNVAGIMDDFLPVGEVDDTTWDRVFAVNVTALMKLTRALIPIMLEQGAGSIVNVTSEAGMRGSAAGVAYTSSKHAVIGMTKNTAFLYGDKGIRCNAVAPGAVATNIEAAPKSELAVGRIFPVMERVMPGVATSEQLAAAICWLASADSMNVNGAILPSDGGWSAV